MKTITRPPVAKNHTLRALRGAANPRVDRQRRIVYGAAIIQKGDLNDDRPAYVDDDTLQQTLQMMRKPGKGMKARWTHPNMSNDGLGQFLGRWKNPRISDNGEYVLADLHLSQLAFKGDHSRGEYVLDMAEQEPDAFGISLAPRWDEEGMSKLEAKNKRKPLRFLSIVAADVVDEPAGTRGGFFGDEPLSIATAPRMASQVLDSLFADADVEVIRERCSGFVETYLANRFGGQGTHGEPEMGDSNAAAGLTREDVQAIVSESLKASLSSFETKLAEMLAKKDDGGAADQQLSQADVVADRTRCKELKALAQTAGLQNWEQESDKWIDKGLSVNDAKATITDLLLSKNTLSSDLGEGNDDPDAKYRKEYNANLSAFVAMDLSLEEYITSRKIEDGRDLLKFTQKPAA